MGFMLMYDVRGTSIVVIGQYVDKTREQLLLLCRGSRRFSVTKSPPENYRRRLWGGGATGVRASSMYGCRDCARKIIISEIRFAPHFTVGH